MQVRYYDYISDWIDMRVPAMIGAWVAYDIRDGSFLTMDLHPEALVHCQWHVNIYRDNAEVARWIPTYITTPYDQAY